MGWSDEREGLTCVLQGGGGGASLPPATSIVDWTERKKIQ